VCALLAAGRPAFAQQSTRVIFLHHSCGENLINEGSVREGLTGLGYEFYDHGYNGDGLRLADGSHSGANFDVPGDNTDPDGFAEIFAQPLHDPPDNTFSPNPASRSATSGTTISWTSTNPTTSPSATGWIIPGRPLQRLCL